MNLEPQKRPEKTYKLHVPADFTSGDKDPNTQWTEY